MIMMMMMMKIISGHVCRRSLREVCERKLSALLSSYICFSPNETATDDDDCDFEQALCTAFFISDLLC